MCIPISVATKGKYSCPVGGKHDVLLAGQTIGLVALVSGLGWNFKDLLNKFLGLGTKKEQETPE